MEKKNCINFKARHLSRVLTRRYDVELVRAGLKGTQFSLLSKVLRLGPISLGELARDMGLDKSSMTRNVQPMVRAGLLEVSVGKDERSRLVSITAAGRAKHAEADRYWVEAQAQINRILGKDTAESLTNLIDDCLRKLEQD